jgi:hypothetical protein
MGVDAGQAGNAKTIAHFATVSDVATHGVPLDTCQRPLTAPPLRTAGGRDVLNHRMSAASDNLDTDHKAVRYAAPATPALPPRINLSSTAARSIARPRSLLDPTQSEHPSRAYVGPTSTLRGRAVRLQFDCSEPQEGKQRAKL